MDFTERQILEMKENQGSYMFDNQAFLDLIAQLKAARDEIERDNKALRSYEATRAILTSRLERARGALAWYADSNNYQDKIAGCQTIIVSQTSYYPDEKTWVADTGSRAEKALEESA